MSSADRVAIVTGANRGLGETVAERLAADGMHVVLAARGSEELERVAERLRSSSTAGQCVLTQVADVREPDQVQHVVDLALRITGRLDALVCNAGVYGPIGRVEDQDWSEWVRAVEVNLLGTVLCCRMVVPHMRAQHRGKIVIMSGGGATQPLPRFSAYAASKAGVVRFMETLAAEVADDGIDVNAVAPGALNTRLLDEVIAAGPERVGDKFYARSLRQREEGGTPLETPAELIAFLISDATNGVTGRLLAAVWDNWRDLPARRDKLAGTDIYTMRRIVPEDRGWPAE
ncbi:MAG: SDR family oxidoreductase [Chloroflexi bacterium]|nr:SDR family oxidoreductase [Chloroflexota bacterium]